MCSDYDIIVKDNVVEEADEETIQENKEKVENVEGKEVCDRCGQIYENSYLESYGYAETRCKKCLGKEGYCPKCGLDKEPFNYHRSNSARQDNYKRCKNCRFKVITQPASG